MSVQEQGARKLEGKRKASLLRRVGVGIADRLKGLADYRKVDPAHKHIYIDAVAHGAGGVFYTTKGDLICGASVEGVSRLGLTEENERLNCERLARATAKLGNKGVPLTLHSVMDVSVVQADILPTDYHNPFLREVEEERNKFLQNRVTWKTTNDLFFEWRGGFSLGGEVTITQAAAAFREYLKAKFRKERTKAHRALYTALAFLQSDKQIMRHFVADAEAEVLRFSSVVDDLLGDITSGANGVGAYKDLDSVVPQVLSEDKVIIRAKRMNAEEAFKALYRLYDPHPERRDIARLQSDFDIADQLGREETNFNYLLGIATGQTHTVRDEDLREVGEHGPFTVGGIARQVFAIRSLPPKMVADVFGALRMAGVPFTVRVRWSPLSDAASSSYLDMCVGRKRHSRRDEDRETAKVLADRVNQGISQGLGGLGMGSILIAINGVPLPDGKGGALSSTKVLLKGIKVLRRWASENNIEIDALQDPRLDQGNAHFSMLPGAWHLDPLEQIPIRNVALGRILPIYSTSPPLPHNTSAPGIPILTLKNEGGEVIQRGLEVGQFGVGFICGNSGFGKSYLFNGIIGSFHKLQGRISETATARTITIDTMEFGSSDDEGSSFNSTIRLLGGKVIQFGERCASDVVNPWDAPIGIGSDGKPEGYGANYQEMLTQLMVTMAGGLVENHGPVTPQIAAEYRNAVVRVGRTHATDLPGKVRSLKAIVNILQDPIARTLLMKWVDGQQLGGYFPAEPDDSRAHAVNWNFAYGMNPGVRAVLFGQAMTQIAQRAYASGVFAKLFLGDELGEGLAKSSDLKEEATLESARRMVSQFFTNGRRFRLRAFLAFQRPSQILNMGGTLVDTLKENNNTIFLGSIQAAEDARKLFGLTQGAFKAMQSLEEHQFLMIQEGLLTKVKLDNPPLMHAASTTSPTERELRELIANSGRFMTLGPNGHLVVDTLGVARAMAECLAVASKPNPEKTLKDFIAIYRKYQRGTA